MFPLHHSSLHWRTKMGEGLLFYSVHCGFGCVCLLRHVSENVCRQRCEQVVGHQWHICVFIMCLSWVLFPWVHVHALSANLLPPDCRKIPTQEWAGRLPALSSSRCQSTSDHLEGLLEFYEFCCRTCRRLGWRPWQGSEWHNAFTHTQENVMGNKCES